MPAPFLKHRSPDPAGEEGDAVQRSQTAAGRHPHRILVPEILDELPPDHPDALASRRDLRRINFLMGNFRWLERQIVTHAVQGGMILEIGAGDGGLAQRVCKGRPDLAAQYHALDLAPRPAQWPVEAVWHRTDLWSEGAADLLSGAGMVVANLFLHHLDERQLRRLGGMLHECRMIFACEPCRRERHVWQGRVLFPVLNRVTRHDMIVSIRAGFRGDELAAALGPEYAGREFIREETCFGAYRAGFRGPFTDVSP